MEAVALSATPVPAQEGFGETLSRATGSATGGGGRRQDQAEVVCVAVGVEAGEILEQHGDEGIGGPGSHRRERAARNQRGLIRPLGGEDGADLEQVADGRPTRIAEANRDRGPVAVS